MGDAYTNLNGNQILCRIVGLGPTDCASYEVGTLFLTQVYNGSYCVTIKTRLIRGSSQAPFYKFCKQLQLRKNTYVNFVYQLT